MYNFLNNFSEKDITSAPTLVVVDGENIEVVENVSNIRRYIETNITNKE